MAKDRSSSKFLANFKNLEISMDRSLKISLMIRYPPNMISETLVGSILLAKLEIKMTVAHATP